MITTLFIIQKHPQDVGVSFFENDFGDHSPFPFLILRAQLLIMDFLWLIDEIVEAVGIVEAGYT